MQLVMAYQAKITRYFRHCLSAVDRDLLHNICWTPADVFSDLSLSTAVSCWEWIMGARQDLELQVTSSLISAGQLGINCCNIIKRIRREPFNL